MKYLICLLSLLLNINFATKVQAEPQTKNGLAKEYKGYMVYNAIDKTGNLVVVKNPVKYKLKADIIPTDNDESYQYRNYRTELNRAKTEKEAQDKKNIEEKKINSAAYYPLYFD